MKYSKNRELSRARKAKFVRFMTRDVNVDVRYETPVDMRADFARYFEHDFDAMHDAFVRADCE